MKRSIREIFESAIELPAEEREAYLRELDLEPDVLERVRAMIELDEGLDTEAADEGSRTHPWPGDCVGAYRLLAPIGAGGMGMIWRACSGTTPEVTVAVKFPDATHVDAEEASARLVREGAVLAAIDHPGVVRLIDAGQTGDGAPYLVLQELTGRPIDVYCRDRRLTAYGLARLLGRTFEALAAVHASGVVHRDLKPAHVLVTDDGWPILIDFGIAFVLPDSGVSSETITRGAAPRTPAFASPEQERGDEVTRAADVFAIGRIVEGLLPTVIDTDSPVAGDLAALAESARRDDPGERPKDGAELARLLHERLQARVEGEVTPASTRWIAAATGVLAILALLIFLRDDDEPGEGLVALPEEVLEAFAEMDPSEVPGSGEAIRSLAESFGEPVLYVAAATRLMDEERYDEARDVVVEELLALDEEWLGELDPEPRLAVAAVAVELGYPAFASRALASINEERLEEEGRLVIQKLRLESSERQGATPALSPWRELAVTIEELDEHEGDGDIGERVHARRIALADPEAIAAWIEDASDADWSEPLEPSTVDLAGLLELHLHLLANGVSRPLETELLTELGEELEDRLHESDEDLQCRRAQALLSEARVLAVLDDDPTRARDLAQAARLDFDDPTLPPDAELPLTVLEAIAARRAGDPESGQDAAIEARALAAELSGGEGDLIDRVERVLETGTTWTRPSASDAPSADELSAGIEDALEERDDGEPWWYRRP